MIASKRVNLSTKYMHTVFEKEAEQETRLEAIRVFASSDLSANARKRPRLTCYCITSCFNAVCCLVHIWSAQSNLCVRCAVVKLPLLQRTERQHMCDRRT